MNLCALSVVSEVSKLTKEELICLRDNIVVPETSGEKGVMLSAYRKIVMMIDDYCEHENLDFIGDVYGYKCKHCHKCVDSSLVDDDMHFKAINGE